MNRKQIRLTTTVYTYKQNIYNLLGKTNIRGKKIFNFCISLNEEHTLHMFHTRSCVVCVRLIMSRD
jgi:hypothetical protein